MYFIPTYEQAKKIVESNPTMTFYSTKHNVDGFNIEIFSYKLAFYKEFLKPVATEDWTAHEVRGLTFIFNKDGSLFNRSILLNKFWNINQNEETLYANIADKKVKSVNDKLDGSIASFILLPNGKVVGRSKASFTSEQAIEITKLYNTNNILKKFVDWSLINNLVAIFEYVSPANKIVLDYKESKLVLLKLRNNLTGEYIDLSSVDTMGVEVAKTEDLSLEEIMNLAETLVDKEGWIIQFDDDSMVKRKTDWYFKRHRLLTESLNRENDVIKLILDEKIDDVVSQLGDSEVDTAKKVWISNIQLIVNNYLSNKIESLNTKKTKYNGVDKKPFVLEFKNDKDFPLLMKVVDGYDPYEIVKNYLLDKTKHLMAAKKFIEKTYV